MAFETGISYMIIYTLTLLLSFLGVYAGAILAFIAPEELKPGRLYFKALMNTVLIFIALIILHSYDANIFLLIVLGVSAGVFLYLTSDKEYVNQIAYIFLGIAFYFSTKSADLFITTASLVFIYGLPMGSLFVARSPKKSRSTMLSDIFLNFGLYMLMALVTNLVALYWMRM